MPRPEGDPVRWNRIKELRKRSDLSRHELAEKLSTSVQTLWRLETGRQQLNEQWMDRIADVIGCEPSDLITEKVTESPLLGYIGAGGMYYPDPESGPWIASGFVPAPPDGSDCSALIVKGSSMEPVYHDGDILYYEVKDLNDKNRWTNHDCIVQIEGGEAYLRTVEMDPKTSKFNLTMYNKEPMLRARIEWAAPILWVRKWNGSKPNK